MKLAIYQIEDTGNAFNNIAKARKAIVNTSADFFVLPEFFAIPGGDFRKDYTLEQCWWETGKPAIEMLMEASQQFQGYLIGGTVLEKDNDLYYNSCHVYKHGKLITKYRKINIIQEEIDLNITPGKDIVTFDSEFGRIGLMVCADCISQETTDILASKSDIIFLPVSLTDPNHPPFEGHPVSCQISSKHNVIVVKVTRIGTFGGKRLNSKSAITTPFGVSYEAGDKELLDTINIPEELILKRKNG